MPDPVIRTIGLSRTYGLAKVSSVTAVSDVTFQVECGEFVAIEGPSGSGKTSLLAMLGAMIRPTRGEVLFDGRSIIGLTEQELASFRLRSVGFVFQYAHLLDALSVVENVELPMQLAGLGRPASTARALQLLTRFGLSERLHSAPATLSGGERQRAAIARALANEPRVVLADEPTGSLDSASGAAVLDLLASEARSSGRPVIVVSHDPRVSLHADRTLSMRDGVLTESGPTSAIT